MCHNSRNQIYMQNCANNLKQNLQRNFNEQQIIECYNYNETYELITHRNVGKKSKFKFKTNKYVNKLRCFPLSNIVLIVTRSARGSFSSFMYTLIE